MPSIQVRDVPENIYQLLTAEAQRERRSLAQQVVAVLARGLQAGTDAKRRRRELLKAIQAQPPLQRTKLGDAARLIREDRKR